jgi:immunity protein 8 of polymorphic toxin system
LSVGTYAIVERAIKDVVGRAEGADWHSVVSKIGRYGHWEFEDYRSTTP